MATRPTARPLRLPPPAERERAHAAAQAALAELRAGRESELVDVDQALDDDGAGGYRVLALPGVLDERRR